MNEPDLTAELDAAEAIVPAEPLGYVGVRRDALAEALSGSQAARHSTKPLLAWA